MSIAEYTLAHHDIKGQKWGVRRFQNADGTLTVQGRKRYNKAAYKEIRNRYALGRSLSEGKLASEMIDRIRPSYNKMKNSIEKAEKNPNDKKALDEAKKNTADYKKELSDNVKAFLGQYGSKNLTAAQTYSSYTRSQVDKYLKNKEGHAPTGGERLLQINSPVYNAISTSLYGTVLSYEGYKLQSPKLYNAAMTTAVLSAAYGASKFVDPRYKDAK